MVAVKAEKAKTQKSPRASVSARLKGWRWREMLLGTEATETRARAVTRANVSYKMHSPPPALLSPRHCSPLRRRAPLQRCQRPAPGSSSDGHPLSMRLAKLFFFFLGSSTSGGGGMGIVLSSVVVVGASEGGLGGGGELAA